MLLLVKWLRNKKQLLFFMLLNKKAKEKFLLWLFEFLNILNYNIDGFFM